jgi:hypothetical protein
MTCQSVSREVNFSADSHFARNSFLKDLTWLLLDVGLLVLGGNGMPDKTNTTACLRTVVGRAFLTSINVFVFDLLERSGYFIYHEV